MSAYDDVANYDIPVDIMTEAISAFQKAKPEGREKLLRLVATYFDLDIADATDDIQEIRRLVATYFDLDHRGTIGAGRVSNRVGSFSTGNGIEESLGRFSEDRSISPKELILQKQPQTDVERIACLAYYLTHYRDMPHFKTVDLSALNTEAAQPKFGNASVAVDNAIKSGYLVQAAKGNKQISAAGEQFVQALPDREAAKAAMASARPKRKARKPSQKKADES